MSRAPIATNADVQSAVSSLRATFSTNKTRSYAYRIAQIRALRCMVEENKSSLIAALKQDLNRCEFEAVAGELSPLLAEIDYVLANLHLWMRPVAANVPLVMAPASAELVAEPFGVCLVIGAFNYPLLLSLSPALGAIMAGNCVVIKPSGE